MVGLSQSAIRWLCRQHVMGSESILSQSPHDADACALPKHSEGEPRECWPWDGRCRAKRVRFAGLTRYQHCSTGHEGEFLVVILEGASEYQEDCLGSRTGGEVRLDRGVPGRNFISRKNLEPGTSSGRDSGNFFPGYVRSYWSFRFEVVQEKVKLVRTAFDLDPQCRARVPHPTSNTQFLREAVDHGTKSDALYEAA